jgi:hypothetical protein
MRVIIVYVLIVINLYNTLYSHSIQHSGKNILLINGFIVDIKNKVIKSKDIYVCDGLIVEESIGKACNPHVIDCRGKYIMPALSDMHVHARGQLDGESRWQNLDPHQVAAIFARFGVLNYLDAMHDENIIFSARDDQRRRHNLKEAKIYSAGAAFTPTKGHGFEYLSYGVSKNALRIVDTKDQALK